MVENEKIALKGRSTIRVYPAGTLKDYKDNPLGLPMPVHQQTIHNLIVTAGKELVADLLLDLETIGLAYHAIGTSSTAPAASDTVLGSESNRKAWTTKFRVGKTLTFECFYLASECSVHILECGVFGGAAASATPDSGTLFSHYLQDYDNSGGLYDLTFEYELEIG